MLNRAIQRCRSGRSFHSATAAFNPNVLVVVDHNSETVTDASLSAVTAGNDLNGDVTILVAGSGCKAAADDAASIANVKQVLLADNETYNKQMPENMCALINDIQQKHGFTHILAPTSNKSRNYLPRVSALMDVQPATDVMKIVSEDTFVRGMYAGNALATITMKDSTKVMTVRPTSFDKAERTGAGAAIEIVEGGASVGLSEWKSEEVRASERADLATASIVVAGGRGLKNGENFGMLEEMATKVSGAVGASRAAVDAGFVPNEYQVGQTGKVVAPDFYFAVGISGAIQHLAGMKDSKVIVCVNKDEEAPIFQVSDYGLVADLFKAVPEMNEKLK